MIKDIDRRIDRAMAGIRHAFRGVVNVVNSAPGVSLLQVSGVANETLLDIEFFQQFGLTSVPPAGSQVIVLPLGGKTSQAVVIGCENAAKRVGGLGAGEVSLYNAVGSSVTLHADGSVSIHAAGDINYDGPSLNITVGDLLVQGHSFMGHEHKNVQNGSGISGTLV